MDTKKLHTSRPVRIKFIGLDERIKGYIVFTDRQRDKWEGAGISTMFTLRLNDEHKTELEFNMLDVDTIDYL